MGIFTLEVAGQAVACIRANTRNEAEESIDDPWFRDGLLGLEREGPPLWNGEAELHIRNATSAELAIVNERIGASLAGEPLDNKEGMFFLLSEPASTPTDHKLILASRVERTPVFGEAGVQIGHIEDLSIDRQDGHVVYAIMSFGGFLGIGKRFHPLPWPILQYDPDRGGYVVPLDRAALKDAPHYDAEAVRDLGGPSFDLYRRHILEYYGPYGPPPI